MHRISLLLLVCLLPLFATAQNDSITHLSARDLVSSYQVDVRILDNDSNIDLIMDSLSKVEPNAYPLMSQWCRFQRRFVSRMANSLSNDYTRDGDIVWIDSSRCVNDAGFYIARLGHLAELLLSRAEQYDQLEQQRIEEEKRAAEERAKAEALRIQREKDARLAQLKDSIRNLHNNITSICDAKGVSDKAKVKELKDIFYSYLAVYNRYDLTNEATDNSHFEQLYELKDFQIELTDSILGPNSFSNRIEQFKSTIHSRSGKDHADVNKSYLRVFKKVQIPVSFKTIAEYREYANQLRDIIRVQQTYIKAIDLRDSISRNTEVLRALSGKKHKEVFSSYSDILDDLNTVPAYTTLDESARFITSLSDFVLLQHEYEHAINRLEIIEKRSDSIISLCTKPISDVASAYKSLNDATDLVPKFINKASADNFNGILDEFEEVQRIYINVIGLRIQIEKGSVQINESKNAPKGLVSGYKQMMKYTTLTPSFNNPTGGYEFQKSLNHFIEIQNKFLSIVSNNTTINNNTKQFHVAFKEYSNINKAYDRLLKTYDYDLTILSEADINNYLRHQEELLAMQQKFSELINSMEKSNYNERLKKVKEPDKIKLIMGVK